MPWAATQNVSYVHLGIAVALGPGAAWHQGDEMDYVVKGNRSLHLAPGNHFDLPSDFHATQKCYKQLCSAGNVKNISIEILLNV